MSTAPAPPVLVPAAPAEAAQRSPMVIAGGAGGLGLAFYIADRLLANDGQIAATMLSRLSPLMGPVWASWPVIVILLGIAAWAGSKWAKSQTARAAADAAAALAAAELSGKVGAVATGLEGLRSEVHELRGALADHADATDARLRDHDAGLRAVQTEVSTVARRVDVLERPPTKRRPARA